MRRQTSHGGEGGHFRSTKPKQPLPHSLQGKVDTSQPYFKTTKQESSSPAPTPPPLGSGGDEGSSLLELHVAQMVHELKEEGAWKGKWETHLWQRIEDRP